MKCYGAPIVCLALLFFCSCKTQAPDFSHLSTTRIEVGPGPEDIALDTHSAKPRLIIACSERRKVTHEADGIYAIDIETERVYLLRRTNEPDSFILRPHGIDLTTNGQGEQWLYVVSHSPGKEGKIDHLIAVYKLIGDELRYEKTLRSDFIISPNDIFARTDGHIFISNDSGRKTNLGKALERLFQTRTANIVEYDGSSSWSVAVDDLSYANGVWATDSQIIAAPTMKKEMVAYDIETGTARRIASLKGLDNISPINNEEIVVAAHPNFLAFIKHAKNNAKKSPGIIYQVNVLTGKADIIYANNGHAISANSSAIRYNNHLYIAQVFDPFILRVKLKD